jgi:hypothetical protein
MPVRLFSILLPIIILFLSSSFSGIAAENQHLAPVEPREYRFHADPKMKHADGDPGEAWLSITPNSDGFFSLKGGVAYYMEHMMNFAGGGVLESDGLIHFSWENILGKGGKGTLRFVEGGKKVILLLGAAENNQAWSLAWTEKPIISSLPTATKFSLTTPREYLYTASEGKYEISTGVVIYPAKDGKFEIGGHLYRTPGKAKDFGGTGKLNKDGLIHFSWQDSFEKKGNGTLRFIEGGEKIALMMGAANYEWILTWTENPVKLDVHTQPSN